MDYRRRLNVSFLPVDTRRCFNVDTTSYNIVRRCIDVETTSCMQLFFHCILGDALTVSIKNSSNPDLLGSITFVFAHFR